MSYRASLPDGERHLVARLESFGDIVIGFSMSQLALQLTLPNTPADLTHPARYVIYFGTFAALAALWFNYHRMMSGAFKPTRLDLALAFLYLACTTVVPLALYANVHFASSNHPEWARTGIGVYVACFTGTSVPATIVAWRNFMRGYEHTDDAERRILWKRLVAITAVSGLLVVALAVVVLVPVDLLWGTTPPSAIVLVLMAPAIRLSLVAFGRRVPDLRRIPPGVPASHGRTEVPS